MRATIKDAALATSLAQSQAMWKLRESVPEAQRHHGASLKHDVSVPVSRIPTLIERGSELVRRLAPEGRGGELRPHGRRQPALQREPTTGRATRRLFSRAAAQLESAMFDLVEGLGGSISAEHGIGRLKAARVCRARGSGRTGGDACAEARARSQGHPQSGQGAGMRRTPSARRMRTLNLPVRTGRLNLREFVKADFDAIHAYSADPRVTRYLFFGPRDEDKHRRLPRRAAGLAARGAAHPIRAGGGGNRVRPRDRRL